MYCETFCATMSVYACIRRQKWSQIYQDKSEIVYDNSLILCLSCKQGKKIKNNPDCSLDRDFYLLKNNHLKVIKERGWIFKDPIAEESLHDNFDYTKIKLTKRSKKNGKHRILESDQRERECAKRLGCTRN